MKPFLRLLFSFVLFCPLPSLAQPLWQSLNGPPGGTVSSIALAPNDDLYLVAAYEKVYKSENGGDNWEQIGFEGYEPYRIFALPEDVLLVCDWNGMWRSADGGLTWSTVSGWHAYSLVQTNDGMIFSATDEGLFQSADAGLHWSAAGLQGQ